MLNRKDTVEILNSQKNICLASYLVEYPPPSAEVPDSRFYHGRGTVFVLRVLYQSIERTQVKVLYSGESEVIVAFTRCAIWIKAI